MDLPTCPSCKQSVLDDDVDDCPFCGASMSGKPSATATAPKPAASSPKVAEKSNAGESEEQAPAGNDPFAAVAEKKKPTKVVPLLPKPRSGRSIAVTCPMCETAGYTSSKAAGRDVKCANPECLVPIFTAPDSLEQEKPEEPEPEPQPGAFSPGMLVALGLCAAVGIGFSLWYFVFRDDHSQRLKELAEGSGGSKRQNTGIDDPGKTDQTKTKKTEDVAPPPPKTLTVAERTGPALESIETTRYRGTGIKQYQKPFAARSAALAYVATGDVPGALKQLESLKIFKARPDFNIEPMVAGAWRKLAAEEPAGDLIKQAVSFKDEIPRRGQYGWNETASLASLLIATGRTEEATAIVDRFQPRREDLERYWADYRRAWENKTYDFTALDNDTPVITADEPMWVMITETLVNHGYAKEALAWAVSHEDLIVRADSLSAYADQTATLAARNGTPLDPTALDAELAKVAAAHRAHVAAACYGRIAWRFAVAENQAKATEWIGKANAELAKIPELPPKKMPAMKELYYLGTIDELSGRLTAMGAVEVGRAQAKLGDQAAAVKSLQRALGALRAATPSPVAVYSVLDSIRKSGDSVKDELSSLLQLDSADESRRALVQYEKQANRLKLAAEQRFGLQVAMLSRFASTSIAKQAWAEAESRMQINDDTREPYLSTTIPSVFARAFRQSGDTAAAEKIQASLKASQSASPLAKFQASVTKLVDSGDFSAAGRLLSAETAGVTEADQHRQAMRIASSLAHEGKVESAFQLARALRDEHHAQNVFAMIAAFATKQSDAGADKIWNYAESQTIRPLSKTGALMGYVTALHNGKKPAPVTSDEETKKKSE